MDVGIPKSNLRNLRFRVIYIKITLHIMYEGVIVHYLEINHVKTRLIQY